VKRTILITNRERASLVGKSTGRVSLLGEASRLPLAQVQGGRLTLASDAGRLAVASLGPAVVPGPSVNPTVLGFSMEAKGTLANVVGITWEPSGAVRFVAVDLTDSVFHYSQWSLIGTDYPLLGIGGLTVGNDYTLSYQMDPENPPPGWDPLEMFETGAGPWRQPSKAEPPFEFEL